VTRQSRKWRRRRRGALAAGVAVFDVTDAAAEAAAARTEDEQGPTDILLQHRWRQPACRAT